MTSWKSNLIEAYRYTTLPYRAWQMRQRRKAGQVPIYALFFHRISDLHPNPWTMSCREFERQIDWFEKNFQIVSLQEAQRRIASGHNTQPTLSITFDDGYSENCDFALPLLIERRIPVTYFVTVQHSVHQQAYAHDLELGTPLPVNSIESLRALDISGIEIGAHTRNHTDLGQVHSPERILDEVITASRELADLIERPIRYFAFPYGQREHLNPLAFQMLQSEGFLGACTTLGGWNEIGGDPFQISRLHGDPNFSRIRNWLSYDPRMAKVKQFEYETECPIVLPPKKRSVVFPDVSMQTGSGSVQTAR